MCHISSLCCVFVFMVFLRDIPLLKIPSDGLHEVKGPPTDHLPERVPEVFGRTELQLLGDSWKWMWSRLKRIKRRPCWCSATGQHGGYGGNDLCCHCTSLTARLHGSDWVTVRRTRTTDKEKHEFKVKFLLKKLWYKDKPIVSEGPLSIAESQTGRV